MLSTSISKGLYGLNEPHQHSLLPSGFQSVWTIKSSGKSKVWVLILLISPSGLTVRWLCPSIKDHRSAQVCLSNSSLSLCHCFSDCFFSGLGVAVVFWSYLFQGTVFIRHQGFLTTCPCFCRQCLHYILLTLTHLNVLCVSSWDPECYSGKRIDLEGMVNKQLL